MAYWLVKSEPLVYSWELFLLEGKTSWEGVRNYQARNNLRAMKMGDQVLFYHSGPGLAVMGIAQVVRESYPDPSSGDPSWLAVDLAPLRSLKYPVSLAKMKTRSSLRELTLIRNGRLSVSQVTATQWQEILNLGKSKLSPKS